MLPVETIPDSKCRLALSEWFADCLAAPSLYASTGLMLSTGFAGHVYYQLGLTHPPVPQGIPAPPEDWRFAAIGVMALAALVAFPFVLIGAIAQARKTRSWRFVVLDVSASFVWFVGLF